MNDGNDDNDDDAAGWTLALAALDLIAAGCGAIVHAPAGPVRDVWLAALAARRPVRRLPAQAAAEVLGGGLDLAATLAAGRPVTRPGLLATLGDALLLVPMAERLADDLAALLASALDGGGLTLVLFDESAAGPDSDEHIAAALADRLPIHLHLGALALPMAGLLAGDARLPRLPALAPGPAADDPAAVLSATALAFGVASLRAPIAALRIARAAAASAGRAEPAQCDLVLATALVLAPRATRRPPPPEADDAPPETDDAPPEAEAPPPPEAEAPPPPGDTAEAAATPPPSSDSNPAERLIEAAQTLLPPGLLTALATAGLRRAATSGRGARQRGSAGGRPAGARLGRPARGKRLALIETIRAAAPWQVLRGRDNAAAGLRGRDNAAAGPRRLVIRTDDLHVRRSIARSPASTVFAVDASGSAAFARLAEAKGAVELLLAQAYVKRAEVALVAFRGDGATLALPPTRSLTRARRELAGLAGGGGTPLAAGIDLARQVAERERARGRSPVVVVLTDGRANVGGGDGITPQAAALASARVLAATGLACVFIDCGTRPRPEARALAEMMAARYATLPRMDAGALAQLVKSAA